MRMFVMLKLLRDEIAAFLHCRLPDPLGERDFIFCTQYNMENMRFIDLLLANQIAYIFRANDKI